jgi:hypothetical protein
MTLLDALQVLEHATTAKKERVESARKVLGSALDDAEFIGAVLRAGKKLSANERSAA